MANLREKESVKGSVVLTDFEEVTVTFSAIEKSIKMDVQAGLKTAQEKLETKSEAIEASNPMEPVLKTGIDLFNGLIDDIIVSFNKD
jgi:hypothetical protein